MTPHLTLYTRRECGLCHEMKEIIGKVAAEVPLELEEIDVDQTPELRAAYGNEVPVLFIDRQKAFKYRITAGELKNRLGR
ncbi:MAG TPA: glutaredoxin family protein [Candidatus Binatia bacterium]